MIDLVYTFLQHSQRLTYYTTKEQKKKLQFEHVPFTMWRLADAINGTQYLFGILTYVQPLAEQMSFLVIRMATS